ncbi:MAG: hypothetical protein QM286_00600 [Acidobacteriota bacterium]|nr:hypothetical protein [Acidobacteriota bacterium]
MPSGLTNPIHPWPGVAGAYNSDTELVYDPDGDRLICYWREVDNGVALIAAKSSTNGTSWSARSVIISGGGYTDTLSPSVIRRGPGDWWLFGIKSTDPAKASVYRSADPLTGWGAPTFANLPLRFWHAGVSWDGDAYRMIASLTGNSAQYLLSSADGYTWSAGVSAMTGRAGEWDSDMYRADLAVRDATTMAVWYSTIGGSEIGYTHMPRALWPAPPAA